MSVINTYRVKKCLNSEYIKGNIMRQAFTNAVMAVYSA